MTVDNNGYSIRIDRVNGSTIVNYGRSKVKLGALKTALNFEGSDQELADSLLKKVDNVRIEVYTSEVELRQFSVNSLAVQDLIEYIVSGYYCFGDTILKDKNYVLDKFIGSGDGDAKNCYLEELKNIKGELMFIDGCKEGKLFSHLGDLRKYTHRFANLSSTLDYLQEVLLKEYS